MFRSRSGPRALIALAGVVAIVVAACGGRPRPPHRSAAASQAAAAARRPRATAEPAAARHRRRRSTRPARPQRRRRRPLVRRPRRGRSAAADRRPSRTSSTTSTTSARRTVYISLEIYNNNVAANILKTQIAAGNAPDIIGPVGVEGLNLFRDQLLDLQPLIDYDRLRHEQVAGRARRLLQARRGRRHDRRPVRDLPVVPLYYNKDLFDEASCRTRRPRSVTCTRASRGTWTPSATLGMKLTVDKNGNDATSADFDPDERRPVGLRHAVRRQQPAGRGGPVRRRLVPRRRRQDRPDPGRRSRTGEKWFNDGVWKDHFIPTADQINSDLLDKGNEFAVGQPRDERVHTLVHLLRRTRRPRPSRSSVTTSASRSPRRTTARPRPSSTPTPSACSRPPSSRTRRSRP